MKGWLDKYVPKAQNGIEGTMGGLTDKGFNYSPAWGGQFAMGGNIPGSVGFTYARTGDIPDNGKYAKKTLPSAQNGQEMKYYQEGLDFQPRTISQNGSLIPADNRARGDMQSYYPQIARMKDTPQRKALAEAVAKREQQERARKINQYHQEQHNLREIDPFESEDTRSWWSDSRAKERGDEAWNNAKKVTAVGQFIPHPVVRYPSIALNSAMGALDSYLAFKEGDITNANINAIGAIPFPGYGSIKTLRNTPGLNARQKASVARTALGALGIDLFGTSADLTNNFGLEQKKQGGVIKDDRGQWAHPGEITQIDSNDITMQGVPYPVLGIGADGQRIMMEPGEDYRFNKGPVTEIPMAQAGKRVPIVVSDPKDPRLKAYNDSLYTYKKGFELAGKLGSIFDKEYGYDKTTKEYKKRLQNLYEGKTGKYTWNTPSIGRMSDKEIQKEINYYDKLNNYEKQVASVLKEYLKLPVKNFTASYSPELPTVLRYKKPVQPVEYRKPEPIVEKPVEKPTQKVVEKPAPPKPMNRYEGRPFYAPGAGVGGSSPLVGFIDNRKGDTTYIQPEDYERFAVDPRGRKYIESKKKLKSGGSVNNVDAQPLKKLDQLLNFTNYNKPTKGGWLDKYN